MKIKAIYDSTGGGNIYIYEVERKGKKRKKSRCAVNERKESQVKVITGHYYY
jgi:hypothetical protein